MKSSQEKLESLVISFMKGLRARFVGFAFESSCSELKTHQPTIALTIKENINYSTFSQIREIHTTYLQQYAAWHDFNFVRERSSAYFVIVLTPSGIYDRPEAEGRFRNERNIGRERGEEKRRERGRVERPQGPDLHVAKQPQTTLFDWLTTDGLRSTQLRVSTVPGFWLFCNRISGTSDIQTQQYRDCGLRLTLIS